MPVRRLKVAAIGWWVLALLPVLVALSVRWFSVPVAIGVAMRAALGVFAWRTTRTGQLNLARFLFVLAPLLIFVGGIAFERVDVPVHWPSPFMPEWQLVDRGNYEHGAWFGDRDNPSMALVAGLALELLLGIAIAVSRRPRA